jgi:hypothetical protein
MVSGAPLCRAIGVFAVLRNAVQHLPRREDDAGVWAECGVKWLVFRRQAPKKTPFEKATITGKFAETLPLGRAGLWPEIMTALPHREAQR